MNQPMQVLTSHASEAWFTPPVYVELARQVLGGIDMDPASCPQAQRTVQALMWLGPEHPRPELRDGLALNWGGDFGGPTTVFLNPPYGVARGQSNQGIWARKLITEYEAGRVSSGILLVNSTHGYRWYEELWTAWPCCCVRERIRFLRPDGTQGGQAKRGQSFLYLGPDVGRFRAVFAGVGRVLLP